VTEITLNIGGKRVKVGADFLNLPPDQQQATVEEISQSLGEPGEKKPLRPGYVDRHTYNPDRTTPEGWAPGPLDRERLEAEKLATPTTTTDYLMEGARSVGRGAVKFLGSAGRGASSLYESTVGDPSTLADNPVYQAGQAVDRAADNLMPQDPRFKDSWTSTLGEGAGSLVPMIGTGVLGVGGRIAGALLGGAAGAGEATDRAVEGGATPDEIGTSAQQGVLPGMLDILPIERLLKVPKGFLDSTIKQAMLEGGQEGVQQFLQNLIEWRNYNPDQELTEGVLENATVGGIIGGGLGAANYAARGNPEQTPPPNDQGLPEITVRLSEDSVDRMPDSVQVDILRAAGHDDEDIAAMTPRERMKRALEARADGVRPEPRLVPDQQQAGAGQSEVGVDIPALSEPQAEAWDDSRPRPRMAREITGRSAGEATATSVQPQRAQATPGQARMVPPDPGTAPRAPMPYREGAQPVTGPATVPPGMSEPQGEMYDAPVPPPYAEQRGRGQVPVQGAPQITPSTPIPLDIARTMAAATPPVVEPSPEGMGRERNYRISGAPTVEQGDLTRFFPMRSAPGVAEGQMVQPMRGRQYERMERSGQATGQMVQPMRAEARMPEPPAPSAAPEAPSQAIEAPSTPPTAVSPPPPPPPVDRMAAFRASNEKLRVEREQLQSTIADSVSRTGSYAAETGDGRTVIVTPSLREPGLYQVTNISRDGEATGHLDTPERDLARDVRSLLGPTWKQIEQQPAAPEPTRLEVESFGRTREDVQAEREQAIAARAERDATTFRPERRESTLLQFLADKGGLRDYQGELRSQDIDKLFVPGKGRLVRHNGVSLDYAREAAVEAGYLKPDADVNDLLDAIFEENRGRPTYPAGFDLEAHNARNDDAKKLFKARRQVERALRKPEYQGTILSDAERDVAARYIADGMDEANAVEAAVMEGHNEDYDSGEEFGPSATQDPETFDTGPDSIPFEDDYDAVLESRAPSAQQESPPPGEGRDGRPGEGVAGRPVEEVPFPGETGEGRGEGRPDADRAAAEDTGADNRPQAVIPGAERVGQGEQAQRRADAPMRPKANQKPADEGLFGDEKDQTDFFAQAPENPPKGWDTVDTTPEEPDIVTKLRDDPAMLDRLTDRLYAFAADILGHRINLKVEMSRTGSLGAWRPPDLLIWVSAYSPDWLKTIRHESIHALRDFGLLTKPEWAVLSREAEAKWIEQFNVRDRWEKHYRSKGLADAQVKEILTEEAVAEAFAHHQRGNVYDGKVAAIFDKLAKFLKRAKSYLRGEGFQISEDVFNRIYAGDVKKRKDGSGSKRSFTFKEGKVVELKSMPPAPSRNQSQQQAVTASVTARTKERFKEVGLDFRIAVQDSMATAKILQEKAAKASGQAIPVSSDFYMAESLLAGRADTMLRSYERRHLNPITEAITRNKLKTQEVDEYLYARHARERNAAIAKINPNKPDGGSGMTDQEAADTIQRFRAAGKLRSLNEVATLVDQAVAFERDTKYAAGLITQEAYDNLQKFRYYVPLRGFEDDPLSDEGPKTGRKLDLRGKEIRRAFGRDSKADSPLAYVLMQGQEAIIRGEKNRVDQVFLRFVRQNPDPKLYEVNRRKKIRFVDKRSRKIVERYDIEKMPDNVLELKIGGEPVWITIHDERLAKAMTGYGRPPQMGRVLRTMTSVMRVYSSLYTNYNPEFPFANAPRDIQTALINVQSTKIGGVKAAAKMLKNVIPAGRGMWRYLRNPDGARGNWANLAREFTETGAKTAWMQTYNVEQQKANIDKKLARMDGSAHSTVMNAGGAILQWIDDANDAFENMIRLAAYAEARDQLGKTEAASIARELTVNFNRRGTMGPQINALYMFANASLQGTARMAQGLVKSRNMRAAVGGIIATGFLMDTLNRMVSGDDEDGENFWDKVPEYVKDRNLILMLPGDPKGRYIALPFAYGYNTFLTMGRKAGEVSRQKTTPTGASADVISSFLTAFNPFGGSPEGLAQVFPTMVRPFVELAENKNFTGQPIRKEPQGSPAAPESQTYWDSTSSVAKNLADFLNTATGGNQVRAGWFDVSPDSLEHVGSFMIGGVGNMIQTAMTTAAKMTAGEDVLASQVPFARRLYGEARSDRTDRGAFHEISSAIDLAQKEQKDLLAAGKKEEAAAARKKYAVELRLGTMQDAVEKEMNRIGRQKNEIRKAKMDDAVRKKRLDALREQELRVMFRLRAAYNAQKKRAQ
jgi:hypothetical protein